MLALVANATQETDAAIVAALATFWLWRHGKLGRTVRKTGRVAAALVLVVVAVRVSPALCVIACGCVIGGWLWKHRHARERRRFQKVWNRGWRRGMRRSLRRPDVGWDVAYSLHMASPAWRRQRDRVVARDRHRCVACGNRYTLNGHHTYYSNPIGHEPDQAIVTLCESCHRAVHAHHRLTGEGRRDFRQATRWVIDRSRQRVA